MKMKPLISIIIPCYNTAQYLDQCFMSLEQQTIGLESLQIILVDDASTDNGITWKYIRAFEKRHEEQVIAIRLNENVSQGGARNIGLLYAEADYVGFVDSDDWLEAEMYEYLYNAINEHKCDMADCCRMENYADGREYVHNNKNNIVDIFDKCIVDGGMHWITDFHHQGYGEGVVTGIYKRKSIEENNIKFPEHMKFEDNFWSAINGLYIKSCYHLKNNLYHYRQHRQSTVHKRNSDFYLQQMCIENLKIDKFKELGLYDKFHTEIERDFFYIFFCNTMIKMFDKCDKPSFAIYENMIQKIRKEFPDIQKNKYLVQDKFVSMILPLIDKKISEEQFRTIGNLMLEYCRVSKWISYNANVI